MQQPDIPTPVASRSSAAEPSSLVDSGAYAALPDAEAILRNLAVGIVVHDKNGYIAKCNASAEAILGQAEAELLGRRTLSPDGVALGGDGKPLSVEDRPYVVALKTGVPQVATVMGLRRPDGSKSWLSVASSPFVDEERGRVTGVVTSLTDVTRSGPWYLAHEARPLAQELETMLAQMKDGILVYDADGTILRANHAAMEFLGRQQHGDDGKLRVVPPQFRDLNGESVPVRDDPVAQALLGRAVEGESFMVRDSHGAWRTVLLVCSPLVFDDAVSGVLVLMRDISKSVEVERRLRRSLHEKQVLLKEVHHRVKNNLQVIMSLLNLQSRSSENQRLREILRDCRGRVRTLAMIHEKLSDSSDLAVVPMKSYVGELIRAISQTGSRPGALPSFRLELDDLELEMEMAIPIALILNELVSNALEHAYPPGESGDITVCLKTLPDSRLRMTVADAGVGLPQGFRMDSVDSLGLQLVGMLSGQLGGTMMVESVGGARFDFECPLPPASSGGAA